jgi:hypothetical protein
MNPARAGLKLALEFRGQGLAQFYGFLTRASGLRASQRSCCKGQRVHVEFLSENFSKRSDGTLASPTHSRQKCAFGGHAS